MSFSNFNRFVQPYYQAIDGNGAPLAYAKLYFYTTGTNTLKNTYTNSALSIANANPVIANSDGVFDLTGIFYAPNGDYHVKCTDQNDVEIWDADPVSGTQLYGLTATVAQLNSTDSSCLNKSADYAVQLSDWGKTILMDASGGPRTVTLLPGVTAGNGWFCGVKKIDSSDNAVTILVSPDLGGGTIDGNATYVLPLVDDSVVVKSNGVNYFVEAETGFFNEISSQLQYLISSAGISPVDLEIVEQTAEAVENYVVSGAYYFDITSVPNVYVAARKPGQEFVNPTQLIAGLRIRFLPNKANTGASTLLFTLEDGTTNTSPIVSAITGGPLVAGDLRGVEDESLYPIVDLEWTGSAWALVGSGKSAAYVGKVYATPEDAEATLGVPATLSEKLLPGTGIEFTEAEDGSTITISTQAHLGTKYISTSTPFNTTNAISNSAASGDLFLTLPYTPQSETSFLKITFSSTEASYINSRGIINLTEDNITLLRSAQMSFSATVTPTGALADINPAAPVSFFAIIPSTGITPRTFTIRYGVASAGGGAAFSILTVPSGFVGEAVLMVEEFLQAA